MIVNKDILTEVISAILTNREEQGCLSLEKVNPVFKLLFPNKHVRGKETQDIRGHQWVNNPSIT